MKEFFLINFKSHIGPIFFLGENNEWVHMEDAIQFDSYPDAANKINTLERGIYQIEKFFEKY